MAEAAKKRAVGAKPKVLSGTPPRARKGAPDADQLAIISEIGRLASLDLVLDSTLQRITDALSHHFGWEMVGCAVVEKERERYVCRALTSSLETMIRVGFAGTFGNGVLGEVSRRARTIVLDDVSKSRHYFNAAPSVRSEICVPVCHRGEVIAVLDIESTKPAAFREQRKLVETVARQIAGVIANARLYDEVRRRAELLEMVSEISRLALDAGDLAALLDRILGFIHEKFGLTVSQILLLDEDGERFELAARAGAPVEGEVLGASWPLTGVVGRVMRSGRAELVTDVHADPDYVMTHPVVVAEFAIPIKYRDNILGVLNLESDNSGAVFSEENTIVLQTLASQVAGGIHMAHVNRRLADTNRLVEERTRELELVNKQLQLANQVLHRLSTHDGLTGISNRRQFDDVLALEWRRASRSGGLVSLIMIDIDFFKDFNDAYGHQAGDDCLKEVAYALQDLVQRAGDMIARYGGEEFGLVLPALAREEAMAFAETLRLQIESRKIRHPRSQISPYVTVSLGVASTRVSRDLQTTDLIAAADRALYAAKSLGRNRTEFAEVVQPSEKAANGNDDPGPRGRLS